jgi:GTP-binding protein
MIIRSATFLKSSVQMDQLPTDNLPEFAFIGRSNVGKSSLINMLTAKNELAKTSGNPGKTQTINHFTINKEWYLVDLPGYGFARVSQDKRGEWKQMIYNYLTQRTNLINIFVLVDLRLDPQKSDLDFINEIGSQGIPLSIVFTKSDKISKTAVGVNSEKFKAAILESWEELPPVFTTSSEKKLGREEILNYIEKCILEQAV